MTTNTTELQFTSINEGHVPTLLPIENTCHSHPWSEKVFRSCIGGRYFGFLAQHQKEVVGFYIADLVADEVTLMDICIDPKHQGKGYGKALMLHLNQQSTNKGATTLLLEVRAKNISALMMYINQGFIEVARRTGYYPSKIGYEDAIVMKKEIS
ncbi:MULTISPECIES: ribosomal protein S18-alanine N-acetyltransferase [Thalassotalea]|uniref:ribosomal protein S18-alanine N-acetyltransferase n=1 Tax=Thalassotalea TaxID=1518149 RepID=UPI000943313B|nr:MULTISPECIES: ribosomal protein S18-alanine N-acetyltransferase [Thalassotalea]OKY27684.1 ribosomal-protein-alanine N-acetyltransferase [Thalassotalea sp. PP2-459]